MVFSWKRRKRKIHQHLSTPFWKFFCSNIQKNLNEDLTANSFGQFYQCIKSRRIFKWFTTQKESKDSQFIKNIAIFTSRRRSFPNSTCWISPSLANTTFWRFFSRFSFSSFQQSNITLGLKQFKSIDCELKSTKINVA